MRIIARLLLIAFAGISAAFSQGYPNRPVRIVVPWPPGQATDIAARLVAEKLVSVLGQPLVIDNRSGAAGTIGTEIASRAAADGYTLIAGSSGPMTISPVVQKLSYDPQKDFSPISLFQTTQFVLVVNPSLPVKSAKELIALLKTNPGKYSFSSAGNASTSHLCVELFNTMTQVTATHVPYKGSVPSLADLVGGQVTYTIDTLPAVASYVKAGRLKALGVSKAKRSSMMPEVPTIAEAGNLPGYDMSGWIGLLAPAGTPREVTARLSSEVRKILQLPEIVERFGALGMDSVGNTPEEFSGFIREQSARYSAIVKQANVKIE